MRAVRFGIVLDRRDLGRDADLVALEVDDAVALLVAAAAEARGDAAVVVAAAGARLVLERASGAARASLVISLKSRHRVVAPRRASRLEVLDAHGSPHSLASAKKSIVVALLEGHDRLLPVRHLAVAAPHAALLAAHRRCVLTLGHLHLEELLDRVADLDLVRVASDLEDDLVALLAEHGWPSP